MAYLKCSPIVINESLTTMAVQFWHGVKSIFDLDTYLDTDEACRKYMEAKRKHFDEYFHIGPRLKASLQKWVSKIPNVFVLPASEMSQFLSANNSEQRSSYYYDGETFSGGTYEYNERNEVSTQRKARISNGYNSMTNATCTYRLDMGHGKQALIFFTFDSDEIKVAQTLIKNKYGSGGMSGNIQVVKIPEWNSVDRNEYLK